MTRPLETCLIPEIIDEATGDHLYPCLIDGCSYRTKHVVGYTNHVKLKHKLQPIDYFLAYIKPTLTGQPNHPGNGICPTCGNKTEFRSINAGYHIHCSFDCSVNDPLVAEKRATNTKAALVEKYGVGNASQIVGHSDRVRATKLDRYGDENYCNIEAVKETNLKRYGHESFLGTQERVAKQREHSLRLYGVDHHTKSSVWKEQIKDVYRERLGVVHPASQPEVVAKLRARAEAEGDSFVLRKPSTRKACVQALRERVAQRAEKEMGGVFGEHVEVVDLLAGRFVCGVCREEFVMPNYGTNRSNPRTYPRCFSCFPVNDVKDSIIQQEFVAWIVAQPECGGCGIGRDEIVLNDRSALGNGKEVDVYIPRLKIGFEMNGNFWHTEVFGSKPKNYHQDKVLVAASRGIRLVHVFEDDWVKKRDLVKEKIKRLLGVYSPGMVKFYARKTEAYRIELYGQSVPSEVHEFFDYYHIQGSVRNLRKDMTQVLVAREVCSQTIIAAMLLTRQKRVHMSREKKNSTVNQSLELTEERWELVRYATKAGCSCVGMAGKLFKEFVRSVELGGKHLLVTSYADLAWSKHPGVVGGEESTMYEKLGFTQVSITQPSYCYVHRSDFLTRKHRYKYRKSELVRLNMITADDLSSSAVTEWDVMQKHGFDRIWDCGKIKYELRTIIATNTPPPPPPVTAH